MMSLPVWLTGPMFLPGGSVSRRVYIWGGLCLGREGLSPGGSLSGRPTRTVMSGWYASYWNAFLFSNTFNN